MSDAASSSPRLPQHVAIIMDGNGRWANERGLSRMEGHEAGTENIRRILRRAAERGVRYLTFWAFSTENWRRPEEEVAGLMGILGRALISETEELHRQGAQLRHIGDLSALDPELAQSVREAMALTSHNDRIILTIAFNYGGRQELIHAVQGMMQAGISPEDVTEETFQRFLYMPDLPDADLIVRTSGEYRLSNFLLWQGAYSELYFTNKYWPDFTQDDFDIALADFAARERRFGATSAQIQNA
ncbi:MAG: di-trans,poly-cis-decaprenylcistransferase [Thermomicrobiales bacterium]|nr:di-trans,poly-cis-decaprenylcistransferase [Thermomicrobiales bacterium]